MVILNKRQFEWFNDCDGYNLFQAKSDKDIEDEVEKLFSAFDHVEVSEDNKIWAVKGEVRIELGSGENAYECAKNII